MNRPPWVGDPSALVVVDWSWWLNRSYAIDGVDSMRSIVIGTLCGLLSWEPAHLAIAVDARETHRHDMRHPLDPEWRYKGDRPIKPREFWTIAEQCTQVVEHHSIPVLWSERREADDVIATATAQARAAGYRVWICSADKDLCGLTDADPKDGIIVGTWNNYTDEVRGPDEVQKAFGVRPEQIADYLAIAGDNGDGVPGVRGLGGEKARWLLGQFGTLDAALRFPVATEEQKTATDASIKDLLKRIKKAGEDESATLTAEREQLMMRRKVMSWHSTLVENEAVARFSRDLTSLDCGCDLNGLEWRRLPIGDFDVTELQAAYMRYGMTAKAREVAGANQPKRAPWSDPWQAT